MCLMFSPPQDYTVQTKVDRGFYCKEMRKSLKHGSQGQVCRRGFSTSPSKNLILSASPHYISTFPAESPSPIQPLMSCKNLKYNLWSLLDQESYRPPLTVLIPLTFFLWFSLIVSILVTSYKRTRADVVRLHKLEHKSVKRLRPQLCWRWSSQDRMATKGPLLRPRSMSLYCLQKP